MTADTPEDMSQRVAPGDLPAALPAQLSPALAELGELGTRYADFHRIFATTETSRALALDERAAGVAELLVNATHTLSDNDISLLNDRYGAQATVDFLTRTAMSDANVRMQQVLAQLGLCEGSN